MPAGGTKPQGFALLELLISMLILAIAILGVIRLQTLAMQNSNQAYWYSLATEQATSMAELIRANNFTPPPAKVTAWKDQLKTSNYPKAWCIQRC